MREAIQAWGPYEHNPYSCRYVWHPLFARLYGISPWAVFDLTPMELKSLAEDTKEAQPPLRR